MNQSRPEQREATAVAQRRAETAGRRYDIFGIWVNNTTYEKAAGKILEWASRRLSRSVYAVDPHIVMRARESAAYKEIINAADLAIPDGRSIAGLMRLSGAQGQRAVCGPDLMPRICKEAEKQGVRVGFLGGERQVLKDLLMRISKRFPRLEIAYACSPPFRQLTKEEDLQVVNDCNQVGVQILFVALGCPKQETWIAEHLGKVNAVMIGVGWAFSIHSGWSRRAPTWMQRMGLEGLFQMVIHPRRYLLRYLRYLPGYCVLATVSLLRAQL